MINIHPSLLPQPSRACARTSARSPPAIAEHGASVHQVIAGAGRRAGDRAGARAGAAGRRRRRRWRARVLRARTPAAGGASVRALAQGRADGGGPTTSSGDGAGIPLACCRCHWTTRIARRSLTCEHMLLTSSLARWRCAGAGAGGDAAALHRATTRCCATASALGTGDGRRCSAARRRPLRVAAPARAAREGLAGARRRARSTSARAALARRRARDGALGLLARRSAWKIARAQPARSTPPRGRIDQHATRTSATSLAYQPGVLDRHARHRRADAGPRRRQQRRAALPVRRATDERRAR